MTQCIPFFACHCALFCQNVQSASFLNVKTFWASSYKICLLVQFCFWSFRAIFHIIIYTDPPHTYGFCIMTNLIMGKTVPLELVYPPFPQCFTSCGIAFMHITAILVNNSFIIHDFQLNNAQDSFVNLFYPSLIYSDYPLILYFIGFPLVDLNSVGYNLVSCGSASGWHKILVPHCSLFMFIEVNVVCQIQEKWKMAIYLKSLHAQIYQVGGQGSPDPHCKNSNF